MTAYDQTRGTNPQGQSVGLPVGGTVFISNTPLGVNSSVNTGWISTAGYGSLLYVIRADRVSAASGIVVDYSDDGINAISAGGGVSYTTDQLGMQIQRALVPKGKFTRITYTNGAEAQTAFRLEVKLSTTLIQPTETSLNVPVTNSNLALVTKGPMEAHDGTGVYDQIYRTGNALNVNVTNTTQPVSATSLPLPTGASTSALQTAGNTSLTSIDTKTPTVGQKTMANSSPVVLASDQSALPVSGTVTSVPQRPTTGAVTEVTVNANNTTLLAANANRKGAIIFSPGTLYVSLGPTCTTTLSTYRMVANSTIEVPFGYTGIITAAGSGVAVDVTELT